MRTIKTISKSWPVLLLVVAISFYSCSEDEECTQLSWYQDIDGDGLGNPAVDTLACEQPAGYVDNADDDADCITVTWYADYDGDGLGDPTNTLEACDQPDGYVANGDDDQDRAETIVLFGGFETLSGTPDMWGDVMNTNGRFEKFASLNGDAGLTAPEGSNYISFVVEDTEEGGQGRFQVLFEDDETIDLSEFTAPHLTVWLNSGAAATNVMAFDLDVRDAERHEASGGDGNLSTFFTWEQDHGDADQDTNLDFYESLANNEVIDSNTGGEWMLYSIPLADANWMLAGNTSSDKVGLSDVNLISRLRFNIDLASTEGRTGDFVVHIDAISITDGPATAE